MTILKPCPFCGEVPDHLEGREGETFRWSFRWWIVSCPSCGASPGDVRINTLTMEREPAIQEAHKKGEVIWNTRPGPKNLDTDPLVKV